jgi:hypothetical protein
MKSLGRLFLFALLALPAACASQAPPPTDEVAIRHRVLKNLVHVSKQRDIAAMQAVLDLRSFLGGANAQSARLEKFDLQHPTIKRAKTDLDRTYILISFPARDSGDPSGAVAIYQLCSNNMLLNVMTGISPHQEEFTTSYVDASKDSSAVFFEGDSCDIWYGYK